MRADIKTIPELEAAIEALLKKQAEDIQADVVTFHYYDEPYDRLVFPIGLNLIEPRRFKSWLPSMDRVAGRIVKTGKPILAEDAEHHPDTTGPFVYAENIKSSAGYPLITSAGKKVGVLFANYRNTHFFSQKEVSFLAESTAEIANTIDTWLTKAPSLRAELSALAGRRREEAALQEIADTVRNVLGNVAVAIWIPGHQSDELIVGAQSGLNEQVTRSAHLSLTMPCSVTESFQNRSKMIGDVFEEKIFPDHQAKAMRLKAGWAYPILSLTRSLGVFCVYPIDYDELTPREEIVVDAWVKQTAATMENHRNILTLTAIDAMGRRLTFTLADPQILMQEIVINAARVMDADSVSLHQYNPVQQEFYSYDKSITHGIESYPPSEKPRTGGISEYIVQHGLVRVTDIDNVDPQLARASNVIVAGVKSYLGIRLKANEHVVGVLFFNFNEKRDFSPDDVTIATTFANYAATAIHNSRIYRESLQRAERLELVRQVAVAVSSTLDLKEILKIAVSGLAAMFGVKQTAVALFDEAGEYSEIQAEYLEPGCAPAMGDKIPLKDNPQIDKILETKRPLIVYDVSNDPIISKIREIMEKRKTLSIMIVPIIIEGEVVGTIGIDEITQKRHFTDDEAELARAIADQVAIAIHNARLIRQVTFRVDALKSLHEVAVELTALSGKSEDLRDVLSRIATSAHTVLSADLIELYQYNQDQDEFAVPPVRIGTLYRPEVIKDAVLKDDILYSVVRWNRPKYTVDALKDEILTQRFSIDRVNRPEGRFVIREKIRSSAGIPLNVGKEIVGVMFVNFRTPQRFADHQKELIELFANQAAIAIRNNRLYSQLQKSNQELNTLQDLMRKLTMETNLDQLLREFLLAIHSALRFEYAFISVVDRDQNTIEAKHGIWQGEIDTFPEWIKLSKYSLEHEDILADLVRTGNVEIISGWDKRFNKEIWDRFNHDQLVRIFMPIKIQDEVLGTVEAGYDKSHQTTISLEEQHTLQAFADQAALAIQNASQYHKIQKNLEERLNDIHALQEITEQMHRGELPAVLSLIAERAGELTGAAHSGVWLVNKTRTALEFGGLPQKEQQAVLPPNIPLAADSENSFSKLVVLNRQSYLSGDVRKDENYKPWYPDTISELTVPISFHERVIGTINVESPFENRFTEEHKRLLEAMAGQAAIVVQNGRLLERLNILDDIGVELTAGIHLKEKEIIELIYSQTKRLTDANDMYIALYDESTGEIRFPLATEDGSRVEYLSRKADMEKRGKTEDIILTRKPILHRTEKEAGDWYAEPGHAEFVGKIQPSWLGVPMMVGERVLGVIAVYDFRDQIYDEQDLQVFSSMANQAAIALENATLYYDVNHRLERRVKALAALNDIARELTSEIRLKEEEIIELIYNQVQRLTDSPDVYIALYDESTGEIRFPLATHNGQRVEYPSRKADMEKRGKSEEIIFTQKSILHETKKESTEWYAQPGHEEKVGQIQSSWLGVPMMVGERVLGVIATLDYQREHAYDEFHREILSSMANQAAIALDNARLYEEARGEVVATKKLSTLGTAIAALQHRINNTFNIIIPNVTRLRSRADLNDPAVVEILDIIERNARYTSAIIARIQEPLKEVETVDININAILQEIVQRKNDAWKLHVTAPFVRIAFTPDEKIPVIRGPSGQIAEIIDNLMDNAYKAMPNGGDIQLVSKLHNGIIMIRVIDCGTGIPQEIQDRLFKKPVPSRQPGAGAGLGLWLSLLMLQTIGGNIKIESSNPTGTTMLVTIPVN
jgi:GAF domain-containing protein